MTLLMSTLDRAVNSLFNGEWDLPVAPENNSPSVDIEEKENMYLVTADLPGVDKKNIDISTENGILTLKAERTNEKKEDGKGYKYYERHSGTFKRSFRLTDNLDPDSITAVYKNGVLTLSVPKKEKAIARKIEIK